MCKGTTARTKIYQSSLLTESGITRPRDESFFILNSKVQIASYDRVANNVHEISTIRARSVSERCIALFYYLLLLLRFSIDANEHEREYKRECETNETKRRKRKRIFVEHSILINAYYLSNVHKIFYSLKKSSSYTT